MQAFTVHAGLVVPLKRVNVDTDQIIPKQFLKRVERENFGPMLFYDWRYVGDGKHNPDFILNRPQYQGASVLVAGANFGCGSSREHAPWALFDFGFRAIIAPSFADIFYNNCLQNGLLPVRLSEDEVSEIFAYVESTPGANITVDLIERTVSAGPLQFAFTIDERARHSLLNGLDDIGRTLTHLESIEQYETRRSV